MDISHTWIKKIASSFPDLISMNKGPITILVANKESERYKHCKRARNLLKIYESGIVDYLVDRYGRPNAIVLFGSYSYGEDREGSDIDIAVITELRKKHDFAAYESFLKRKISLQEIWEADRNFLVTLANGIVLHGFLEIK